MAFVILTAVTGMHVLTTTLVLSLGALVWAALSIDRYLRGHEAGRQVEGGTPPAKPVANRPLPSNVTASPAADAH